MASVVFLRASNVGGHRTFSPAAFVRELAHLDAVNLGAAGTFVIRATVDEDTLRAEIARRLPFETEILVVDGDELVALLDTDAFASVDAIEGAKRHLSVLAQAPTRAVSLPIDRPATDAWEVRLVAVVGRCALSVQRKVGPVAKVYPNAVVEKELGVAATTRNWNTLGAIVKALRA
jgi:uncharacterized protein (DUF1697 family)